MQSRGRLARRKDDPCTGKLLVQPDDLVRQPVKPAEVLQIGMYVPKEPVGLRFADEQGLGDLGRNVVDHFASSSKKVVSGTPPQKSRNS